MFTRFVIAAIGIYGISVAATEVVDPGMQSDSLHDTFLGTRKFPVATAEEIKCMLEKTGVDGKTSQTTSESLTQAMQMMNFDTSKFTRTCLMHFLAQIRAESSGGTFLTQQKPKTAASTGYGYIQITGLDNRNAAAKCMNGVSPGMGDGVASDPEHTIGASGNPLKAAVASLCWWNQNIVSNNDHQTDCNESTEDADGKITQFVNCGHLCTNVTNGIQNIKERAGSFTKIKDSLCRQYSI